MSENEKFEVSSEWSAEAQIDADKYNEWYENSLNVVALQQLGGDGSCGRAPALSLIHI